MRALDEILPVYDAHERHEVVVDAGPEAAVAAFFGVDAAPGVVTRALLRARGLETSRSVEELLGGIGFVVLRRTPTEVVLGAAGRPWTPRGDMRPFAAVRAGDVRVAVDVRASALTEGRSRLSTET
ncbi:MAG: hypothetical protein H0W16_11015, partial [Actinobacteria bacterium]|nr:hypothetical protein [Actinomycetota bacterium]